MPFLYMICRELSRDDSLCNFIESCYNGRNGCFGGVYADARLFRLSCKSLIIPGVQQFPLDRFKNRSPMPCKPLLVSDLMILNIVSTCEKSKGCRVNP